MTKDGVVVVSHDRELNPDHTRGPDGQFLGGSAPRLVAAAGCQTWLVFFRDLTDKDLARAKALGLKVIPWTVNEPGEMEWLMNLGVDGLITDYPDRLRALMAEKDMPQPPQVSQR